MTHLSVPLSIGLYLLLTMLRSVLVMLLDGTSPQEARELRRMRMRLRREARLAHEQAQRRARAAAADEAAKQHVRDAAAERLRTRAQRAAAATQKLEQVWPG